MSGRKQRRQQPCESLSNNLQEFCLRILRILSAWHCLRLGRRWGTDKTANWLCRQMIAANAANQGEATFESIERLRSTPSELGAAPKGPNSG
jgi:hypothetical protein